MCTVGLYLGDVYSLCQKWKVKVLDVGILPKKNGEAIPGTFRCICCRRELAETVAALQQRRLLTEAKEYTLSIKVLGQLGPQPLELQMVLCGNLGFWKKKIPCFCPTKGFWEVCFWIIPCACTEGQVRKIYILKSVLTCEVLTLSMVSPDIQGRPFKLHQNHQHPNPS